MRADSSTGLTTRTASTLAYLGWWVTGLILWAVERRDRRARFHAIQSTVAFGALGLTMAVCGVIALLMLSYAPTGFSFFLSAALAVWVLSVVLWLVSLWKASQGEPWRIPLAARAAERWNAVRGSGQSQRWTRMRSDAAGRKWLHDREEHEDHDA